MIHHESRQEIPGKPSYLFHAYLKALFGQDIPSSYVNKDHKESLTFHIAEGFSLSQPNYCNNFGKGSQQKPKCGVLTTIFYFFAYSQLTHSSKHEALLSDGRNICRWSFFVSCLNVSHEMPPTSNIHSSMNLQKMQLSCPQATFIPP